jgi:ABC-2 type transport system ATP-binding protein
LVLLDEPTSALDPVGRQLVRELLATLREQGISVLLNSHLLGEVERSCDRVFIMQKGKIVRSGTTDDLTHSGGVEVELASGVRDFPDATRDDVPRIVHELVEAGEQVYRVTPRRSTLEDAYLEAVGTSEGASS